MGLLVSLLWLAAALGIARLSAGAAAQALAAVLAAVAGTTLPDLDLLLGLGHRSGLTHSPLPLLLAGFAGRGWRGVSAGLALGIGLHLAADCFPNAMRGYATVKLPAAGSIGAGASYLWLAIGALLLTGAGAVLLAAALPTRWALAAALAIAMVGAGYLFATDGGWPALCVYGAFGWLGLRRGRVG